MKTNIQIVIETDSGYVNLDLFDNETIELTNTVQQYKDINKVFTDFSRTFKVPASRTNNSIFKHYYNVDIIGGFNNNKKIKSKILLNELEYKKTYMRLESVTLKNGLPDTYSITLFGATVSLRDLIGDDLITDLDLTAYESDYTAANVVNSLNNNTPGDVVYNLISKGRDWQYVSDYTIDDELNNIAYIEGETIPDDVGIEYNELRPSLKLIRIVEAIEDKYGIDFGNNFFDETTHFGKLYMWGGRPDDELKKIPYQYQTLYWSELYEGQDDDPVGYERTSQYMIELSAIKPTTTFNVTITPRSGYETVAYDIQDIDGRGQSGSATGTYTFDFDYNGVQQSKIVSFYIRSTEEFSCDITMTVTEQQVGFPDSTEYFLEPTYNLYNPTAANNQRTYMNFSDLTSSGDEYDGILPTIKITEFLNGLVHMFNLVIIPTDYTTFNVIRLDDWYGNGVLTDFTSFIDNENILIKRPELKNEINFIYTESDSIINKNFFDANGRSYGDLVQKYDFDGESLDINIPFQNLLGSLLVDLDGGVTTSVYCVKAISEDGKQSNGDVPYIYYHVTNYTTTDPIVIRDDDNSTNYTIYPKTLPLNMDTYNNPGVRNTLNFGEEISGLTYEVPPTNPYSKSGLTYSLFSNHWENYVADLYNDTRRIFVYDLVLPFGKTLGLNLNDKIVINNRRYLIDKLEINLTQNTGKLTLLNEIYSNIPVDINEPPSSVTNLTYSNVGDTYATLSWTAATDPDGTIAYYEIYTGAGAYLGSTSTPITSITVTSLFPDETYSYKIMAVDNNGDRSLDFSNTVEFTTGVDTGTPPATGEFRMDPYGQATVGGACAQTLFGTFYHDGIGTYPLKNDTVYTDSGLTLEFNGGELYYKFDDGSYTRINNSGVVLDIPNTCS